MRKARTVLVAVLALAAVSAAGAQAAFPGLSAAERATIASGGAVTRVARNADALVVPAAAPGAAALVAEIRALRPNYLVETMASIPAEGRDLGAALRAALADPESWIGIPYWSERNEKTYDLFDKCVVRSRSNPRPGSETIEALQHMKPFDDYVSRYGLETAPGSVGFSGANLSPLVYKGVRAVEPGKLQWRIAAWSEGGYWHFYGVGAVKAFDMLGAARARLEPSFIGRTRAFFDFMRGRLAAAR